MEHSFSCFGKNYAQIKTIQNAAPASKRPDTPGLQKSMQPNCNVTRCTFETQDFETVDDVTDPNRNPQGDHHAKLPDQIDRSILQCRQSKL
jgi:hypothetical protein